MRTRPVHPRRGAFPEEWLEAVVTVWWILLSFAGVVVLVNVLVIALCAVAGRSDEALGRLAEAAREEVAPSDRSAVEPPPVAHTDARRA